MNTSPEKVVKGIRVLVADSSRIHTQLLSEALRRDPDLTVVQWDWNPARLIPVVLTQEVDVLAISSAFNDHAVSGLDVVRELRTLCPETKIVVLLDSPEDQVVVNALRCGARGIFNRESSAEIFCKCIHAVRSGEVWADRREISLAVEALAATPEVRAVRADGVNLLSQREAEVVRCVVQGLTNQEIAEHLGLSPHTIKNYLLRVFDKLGVSNRVELLFMTLSQGGNGHGVTARSEAQGDPDEKALAVLEEAAEKGMPVAQLSLAQEYLTRQAGPDDLVQAYMWYLIAAESISQARSHFTKTLSLQQVEEAHQRANTRIARSKRPARSAGGVDHPKRISSNPGYNEIPIKTPIG